MDNLVLANQIQTLPLEPDVAISFKGQRGTDIRALFTTTLDLSFDIGVDNKSIKLRGSADNVAKGIEAIKAFIVENFCQDYPCDGEDCLALIAPAQDAEEPLQKCIETEFQVDIYVNRKDGIVRVRGSKENVQKALASIASFLSGDLRRGSVLVAVNKMSFSALIGKGGQTLKKFEADNQVKLDLLKTKGLVRIRGSAEQLPIAKANLVSFLDEVKSTNVIDLDDSAAPISEHLIQDVQSWFGVEVSRTDEAITIKGLIRLVDAAHQYLEHYLTPTATVHLSLPAPLITHFKPLLSDTLASAPIAPFISKGIKIEVDDSLGVAIHGPAAQAFDTRKVLARDILAPTFDNTRFTVISMSQASLIETASRTPDDTLDAIDAAVELDLPSQSVYISGTSTQLTAAKEYFQQRAKRWDALHPVVPIEEHLLSPFVGKGGAAIIQLEKDTKVRIRVNRQMKRLELENCSDPEVVSKALEIITARVEELRAGHWEVSIQGDILGNFIGKEGATIKRFRAELGVNIDIDNKTGLVRVCMLLLTNRLASPLSFYQSLPVCLGERRARPCRGSQGKDRRVPGGGGPQQPPTRAQGALGRIPSGPRHQGCSGEGDPEQN